MKKILAVDDDINILESLKLILSEEGYEMLLASSAATAIRTILHEKPDLVLLDIKLPDFPGTEVARRIKNNNATKSIPVILVSANYDAKYLSHHVGADSFIEKPFNISDITTTVKQYIH